MKAFPIKEQSMKAFPNMTNQQGMDLRDYFAAKAMQSLLWNPDADLDSKEDVCAAAYEYADEMIKVRAENEFK